MDDVAPWWLPGGNLQTIWPALHARRALAASPGAAPGAAAGLQRERWTTPDGDFIDVDFALSSPPLPPTPGAPLLVLFHGLEGSSASHYSLAFAHWCRQNGLGFAVPHFRGCSGELNRGPRAYHSGDYEEIDWILRRLRTRQQAAGGGKLLVVGISLGGNALMRWAGELGIDWELGPSDRFARYAFNVEVARIARRSGAARSCAGCASGMAIGRGFNRQVYTRMFLATMRAKALAKLEQHPGLFDRQAMLAARDLYEFDNLFTAPLHGFRDTDDYWARASAKPHLGRIRIPALLLNAKNDPFVPAASLPRSGEVGRHVTLWQPHHGGHVGFAQGRPPGHVMAMPRAVGGWLLNPV